MMEDSALSMRIRRYAELLEQGPHRHQNSEHMHALFHGAGAVLGRTELNFEQLLGLIDEKLIRQLNILAPGHGPQQLDRLPAQGLLIAALGFPGDVDGTLPRPFLRARRSASILE